MTTPMIDDDLLEQLHDLAMRSTTPLAEMSMEAIARDLGMTRMTLYRKAGTRDQLVAALGEVGINAARLPDVHERVVSATVDLLRERPIGELTLDLMASRAHCSLPAIHARFGGRQGVLKAVIERHSPLFTVKEIVEREMGSDPVDLRHDIFLLYATLFGKLSREWPVLRAFIAEVLRDPESEVVTAFRDWYLPQARAVIVPLFERHMEHETMRRLPVPMVAQLLVAPMALHVASRDVLRNQLGFDLPDPEATIEIFTDMFCRAVGTEDAL